MKNLFWRAPCTIPRDGSWVIILNEDRSNVNLLSYYSACKQWITLDGDLYTDENDEDYVFAGWIPAPEDTPEYEVKTPTP